MGQPLGDKTEEVRSAITGTGHVRHDPRLVALLLLFAVSWNRGGSFNLLLHRGHTDIPWAGRMSSFLPPTLPLPLESPHQGRCPRDLSDLP